MRVFTDWGAFGTNQLILIIKILLDAYVKSHTLPLISNWTSDIKSFNMIPWYLPRYARKMFSLTVYGICLFWQLNGIWGDRKKTLRSRKLEKVWLWIFDHMFMPIWRHKIKNKLTDLARSVNYRQKFQKSRFLEMQLIDMLTIFCRIVNINVKN